MESTVSYLGLFAVATLVSVGLTGIIRLAALRWNIVDDPAAAPERKKQTTAVPLLGGLAVYLTLSGVLLVLAPQLTGGYLLFKHIIGIIFAGGVLMIGGILDDKYSLSPVQQIGFPVVAAIIVVAAGIGIPYITNPLGGILPLNEWQLTVFTYNNTPYQFTVLADLFAIVWLVGTMYTTKLLDGVDGLVSGITVIGAFILFALSISDTVQQPETATLAIIIAGASLGFLLWNVSPAKIYLGEGGSLLAGFLLGVLAIISGAKIATALLILGLPIIDIAWVMIQRKWIEGRSMFSGDTLHLHYQLQQFGWSQRSVVLLFYVITAGFGVSTLATSSLGKVISLALLVVVSVALLWVVFQRAKRLKSKEAAQQ